MPLLKRNLTSYRSQPASKAIPNSSSLSRPTYGTSSFYLPLLSLVTSGSLSRPTYSSFSFYLPFLSLVSFCGSDLWYFLFLPTSPLPCNFWFPIQADLQYFLFLPTSPLPCKLLVPYLTNLQLWTSSFRYPCKLLFSTCGTFSFYLPLLSLVSFWFRLMAFPPTFLASPM